MRKDYWDECIRCALDECGITATEEQVKSLISSCETAHEMYDEHSHHPENPLASENERLKRELKKEQDKVVCTYCAGSGRIFTQGPYHGSISSCFKCGGEGYK